MKGGASGWVVIGAAVWWVLATVLVLLLIIWGGIRCPWFVAVYLVATVLVSIAAFVTYGLDKHYAKTEKWRVSEKTLHWLSALGGWPGGLIAQQVFRHKTQKLRFRVVFWLIVIVHLPLILYSLLQITVGG